MERKATIKRKGKPDTKLADLEGATPLQAIDLLLSPAAAALVRALPADALDEIGGLLVGLGDALGRTVPPAVRLDFQEGMSGFRGSVQVLGDVVWSSTALKEDLPKLFAQTIGATVNEATQANTGDGKEPTDQIRSQRYARWSMELGNECVRLDEAAHALDQTEGSADSPQS